MQGILTNAAANEGEKEGCVARDLGRDLEFKQGGGCIMVRRWLVTTQSAGRS